MKLTIRKAAERGCTRNAWLESYHSFSFGDYRDESHNGFGQLRVINDDLLAADQGFATHPHRDMEIFSYVLAGRLEHRDSLGNHGILLPGQIQLMSAGSGVRHSEFNPDKHQPVHFLQIWIKPSSNGLSPGYSQWQPDPLQAKDGKLLVISADGRAGSARINQQVDVYLLKLQAGQTCRHENPAGRSLWLQVAAGSLQLNQIAFEAGDGASLSEPAQLEIVALDACEALLFDLADLA